MGWFNKWYPDAIQALTELRGAGSVGIDGVPMPMISPLETVSVLSVVAKPICEAIETFMTSQNGEQFGKVCLPSALLRDGVFVTSEMSIIEVVQAVSGGQSVPDYLQGAPHPEAAWKRTAFSITSAMRESMNAESLALLIANAPYYEPWITDSLSQESDLLSQVDQLVVHWQQAVDASAATIVASGLSFTNTVAEPTSLSTFLVAIRKICIDLDALASNPPQLTVDKVRDAVKDAIQETGKVAGETAADVADSVGRTAGAAAAGFLDRASIMAIAVAGVAIAIMLR